MDLDPEHRQMTHDRAAHHTEADQGGHGRGRRNQQSHHDGELDERGGDPSPRLHPEGLEDVHRLGRSGELEEQGLAENGGRDDLGGPSEPVGATVGCGHGVLPFLRRA